MLILVTIAHAKCERPIHEEKLRVPNVHNNLLTKVTYYLLSGVVTIIEWTNVMESVLQLRLPWSMIRKQISVEINDGTINYESCLDRYQIEAMISKVQYDIDKNISFITPRFLIKYFTRREKKQRSFTVIVDIYPAFLIISSFLIL